MLSGDCSSRLYLLTVNLPFFMCLKRNFFRIFQFWPLFSDLYHWIQILDFQRELSLRLFDGVASGMAFLSKIRSRFTDPGSNDTCMRWPSYLILLQSIDRVIIAATPINLYSASGTMFAHNSYSTGMLSVSRSSITAIIDIGHSASAVLLCYYWAHRICMWNLIGSWTLMQRWFST